MKGIHFRPAILDDLPILHEFEQGIITAERPFDKTLKEPPISYYNLEEMVKSKNVEVIVATFKKEIIGSAYARIEKAKPYLKHAHYAYLGFMYVAPEYRGEGINKKIIEELKIWVLSKNINEIRLNVYSDNVPAVRAYEKAGFQKHLINMRMKIS